MWARAGFVAVFSWLGCAGLTLGGCATDTVDASDEGQGESGAGSGQGAGTSAGGTSAGGMSAGGTGGAGGSPAVCIPECSLSEWCDEGTCVPKSANGEPCDAPGECASGFCPGADGVCCDTACDATCEACVAAKTAGVDGACTLIASGADPDGECVAEDPSTCGVGGLGCTGSDNSCVLYPAGTTCAPTTCTAGLDVPNSCDGVGTCEAGQATDCTPYACDAQGMACRTSCSVPSDCAQDYTCENSVCVGDCTLVKVGYMPGYQLSTNAEMDVWTELETNFATYGSCPVDVVDVAPGFTLGSLTAAGYTTLVFSYPSWGGNTTYTATERQAVIDFAQQGHGGIVALWLIYYSTNLTFGQELAPLVGLDSTQLAATYPSGSTNISLVNAAHPLATALPTSFEVLVHPYNQGIMSTWSAALLANASIVAEAPNQTSPIIAYDGGAWRGAYFGGISDYLYANADTAQALYNAIYWTSGN